MTNVETTIPQITIEGKQFGRGKQLFPTWQMALPDEPVTLRGFLTRVVRQEVTAYRERQERRSVLNALTAAQIAEGVEKGKIDLGGRPETVTEADESTAIENALRAFEDGLFFVFVDEVQQERLDDPIPLREGSRVLFLRLVALAGG
ncbi:MAG: hypothetical protein SFU56_16195 [Capsulimonadales bacterium]|nr:hypothetical protein [Capsulimonadales bacterium]